VTLEPEPPGVHDGQFLRKLTERLRPGGALKRMTASTS
jgi:hypothetical protein